MTLALLHHFDSDSLMRKSRERLKKEFDRLFSQFTKYLPEDSEMAAGIRRKYDFLANQDPKNLRVAPIIIFALVLIPLLSAGALDSGVDLWMILNPPTPTEQQNDPSLVRNVARWIAFGANIILPPAAILGGVQVFLRHLRSKKYSKEVEQIITEGETAISVAREIDGGSRS